MHEDQYPEAQGDAWTKPTASQPPTAPQPVVGAPGAADPYAAWPNLPHDAVPTPPSGQPSGQPVAPAWTPAPAPSWAPGAAPPPPPGSWAPAGQGGWVQPAPAAAPGGWGGAPGGPVPPGTAWPYGYYPTPPAPPTRQANPKRTFTVLAAVVAVLALGLGAAVGHATWPTDNTSTSSALPPSSGSGIGGGSGSGSGFPFGGGGFGGSGSSSGSTSTGAGAPSNISAVAAKISPALVDINTNLSYQNEQAAGTGIVLTADGEVLTNNHVIDGATSISATDVGNGQTYKANVVGYDRTGDIAVIQLVGASKLTTAPIASSAAVLGQAVVGVGNAGGKGGTPSAAGGSVTALDQAITASDSSGANSEKLVNLIETNCNIQPGDSGGALVNDQGKVLGMNTAASTSAASTGGPAQSYAIPIAKALSEARQIVAGRASSTIHIGATGFLGIQVQAQNAVGSSSSTNGAVVVGTLANSAGANAGLVQGDTITGFDGSPVNTSSDLTSLLESHHPGDVVRLDWVDANGQTHSASATLGTGPPA